MTIGASIRAVPPDVVATTLVNMFDAVGTMWVNAIRMTEIPLIAPLLIGAIAGAHTGRDAGTLGVATIGAFMPLVAILAAAAALAAPLPVGSLHIDSALMATLRASVTGTVLPTGDASIGGWFKALGPTNPICGYSGRILVALTSAIHSCRCSCRTKTRRASCCRPSGDTA